MIFFEIFCHNPRRKIQRKSIMTSSSAANWPKAPSPGAPSPGTPSPRSGGVSPPPQGKATHYHEGTSPPKRSRRELPACFESELQERSGASVPDVPSQEAKHAAAKRDRRVSKYIPAKQDGAGNKRCRKETVSPPRSGSGSPEAQPTQEQNEPPSSESPPRSGSGAPEVPPQEDAYRRVVCGRRVPTPSNSDDEPPSPALLDPKRPLSPSVPPSQEEAHSKAKKPKQRVVKSLPDVIREAPIEVFFEFDGVPSQEEIHAAAKRHRSMRRGSSPLRELSPDPSGGRSPDGV